MSNLTTRKILIGIWAASLLLLSSAILWPLAFLAELFIIALGFEVVTILFVVGLLATIVIFVFARKRIVEAMPERDFAASIAIVGILALAVSITYFFWKVIPNLLWYW